MKKTTIIISIIITICLISLPLITFAYRLLQSLPGIGGGAAGPGLTDYLNWLFRFMLVAAAFLAVVQIVIGGIQMIIGGASETQRSSAKSRIQDALWGLLLALASWLILYTINPNLASMQLTIPEVVIEGTAPVPGRGVEPLFDPGIQSQTSDASVSLSELINCMRNNLPTGVGRISSISDSNNRVGTPGFSRCASCPRGTRIAGCAHVCGSCHYGGGTANQSYGVDFGDAGNRVVIEAAARGCGAPVILNEGSHLHISKDCPGGGN